MAKSRFFVCVSMVALGLAAGMARADRVDELIDKLVKAGESVKSMQYKTKMVQKQNSEQYSYHMTSQGTYEFVNKGDKYMFRMETKSKTKSNTAGTESEQDSENMMICDGEYLYTISDTAGQKTAMKMLASPEHSPSSRAQYDSLKQFYNLEVMPDDKVDGRATYVLKATPKQQSQPGMPGAGVSLYYYDKETGVPVKTVTNDGEGNIIGTTETTDLRINSSVDESRFVFEAPDGVQVIDMTAQQRAGQQGD